MKTVYICSPYSAPDEATLERNKEYARELTKIAIDCGFAPITPHLYITQVVDDTNIADRSIGLRIGLELLKKCDAVIYGTKYGISEGMEREIKAANFRNIPYVDIKIIETCKNTDEFAGQILCEIRRNKYWFKSLSNL